MACLTFPNSGLVPGVTTYVADNVTYLWDGTVWEAITAPLAARQITFDSTGNVKDKIDENISVNKAQLIAQGLSGNYGFFADGFTYVNEGDVGITADNAIWIYTGAGAPNKVVSAGTVPSVSEDFEQVTFNQLPATNVTNANGGNVQQVIDSLPTLKFSREDGSYKVGDVIKIKSMFYDHTFTTKTPFTLSAGESLLDKVEAGLLDVQSTRSLRYFEYPTGWTGKTPQIIGDGRGNYSIVGWIDDLFRKNNMVKPYGARNKIYYVTMDGLDSNGGLSESDSLRTVNAALDKPDCLTIMLKGGGHYSMTTVTSYSVNIIGYKGKAIIFSMRVPTGVYEQDNVYSFTETVPHGVPVSGILKDEFGTPIPYKKVNSIAEVADNPLSYYNSGNTCYLHATSAPTNGVDVFISPKNFGNSLFSAANNNSGNTLYIEDLIFPNSIRAISNTSTPFVDIYALNVTGAVNAEGSIDNAWEVSYCNTYFNRCNASYSYNDGFNYELGEHIEYKCVARGNFDVSGSNQASTTHNASPMLRVDCDYETSNQNVVLDVDNEITINIGVRSSSESVTPAVSFAAAAGRTMYCYDCTPLSRAGLSDGHYRNDNTGGEEVIIDGLLSGIQVRKCSLSGE